jgi:hypothetical protein
MANKPEFVDLISDATRQNWRRTNQRTASASKSLDKDEAQNKRRLSSWPPARFA